MKKYLAYILAVAVILLNGIPYIALSDGAGADEERVPKSKVEKMEEEISESGVTITVKRVATGEYLTLPLEEYVACVVASEMYGQFEMEALKAQAVAARTYGLARVGDLCDTVHCQAFATEEELREKQGDEWMDKYWGKFLEAAVETQGEVVYYDDELASYLMFHSSSGGRTENSEEVFPYMVPYLRSVKSPYEDDASHKQETQTVSIDSFVRAVNGLNRKPIKETDVQKMEITARTTGGRVKTIQIGNNEFTGGEIRDLFGLASANFTYNIEDYHVIFTTTGFGHGVGMSQYGANGMAKKGYNYKQILKHYYTGIDMGQVTDEIIEKSNNTTGPAENEDKASDKTDQKTEVTTTEKTTDQKTETNTSEKKTDQKTEVNASEKKAEDKTDKSQKTNTTKTKKTD